MEEKFRYNQIKLKEKNVTKVPLPLDLSTMHLDFQTETAVALQQNE